MTRFMLSQGLQNFVVWRKAVLLVKISYGLIGKFPDYENYSLAQQVRRACISIPANIAEGRYRVGKDFQYHMSVARGSCAELQNHFVVAKELSYIGAQDLDDFLKTSGEVMKMLNAILKK